MLRNQPFSRHRTQDYLACSLRREFSVSLTLLSDRSRPNISSVTPSTLTSDDYLDLSGQTNFRMKYQNTALCDRINWGIVYGEHQPFPDNTKGFFYYHSPQPKAPSFAGDVRFRVCPSNDPISFPEGVDLVRRDGLPWEITNWGFALEKRFSAWGDELVKTGTMHKEAHKSCRRLATQKQIVNAPHNVAYAFEFKQPFPLQIGRDSVSIWISDEINLMSLKVFSGILEPFNSQDLDVQIVESGAFAHACFDLEGEDCPSVALSSRRICRRDEVQGGDTKTFQLRRPTREALDILKHSAEMFSWP
ncbi:hypothetical protein D9758_005954 [Tetrapyrgos nigripes]|uniref:Uncharacterized protein n=1 Tax=Tetrapyrgos nigripes TaxID=182062 RepID=A0A8H5LHA7_9AGAR|nr:hypothetical protein D9758_005954 [Tetrapyrgos nigripes]